MENKVKSGGEKMRHQNRIYIAIDLKSFYASVECKERGLNPLTTHLVVADSSRTEKTICLAVSPSLKKYGISGRARLFEVIQRVKEVNMQRRRKVSIFKGESYDEEELQNNPELELTYIVATPRMSLYIDYSTKIYEVYLKYVSLQDMHVYSIDEVFMDITSYLKNLELTPREFVKRIILDILETTGITAAAGIGTNLYLCKVAMDIVAKHIKAKDGVRIAQLDEKRYRQLLWNHKPITDFWRIGQGYKKRLEKVGLYTMGDIAKCSVGAGDYYNEDLLYDIFGINAELLIDHSWGYEPCTIKDIKEYKPANNSIGTGQVLSSPYCFDKARLVVKEMLDSLASNLVDKNFVTNQIVLTVGYDKENLSHLREFDYEGEIMTDYYGRKLPKSAHGTINLGRYTSSAKIMIEEVMKFFDRAVDRRLVIKRINISANHVKEESIVKQEKVNEQMDLFTDYEQLQKERLKEKEELEKEKKIQQATLELKKKFGKNAVLKGMNLEEGATTIERNGTIGGHKA